MLKKKYVTRQLASEDVNNMVGQVTCSRENCKIVHSKKAFYALNESYVV